MDLVLADVTVPALWLRDACACAECRDAGSGQRLRGVSSLDPATSVVTATVYGDDVAVRFDPDGHEARFSLGWLIANAPGRARVFDDRSESARTPWRAADLADGVAQVGFADLRADSGAARAVALRDLFDSGVLLVRDVPTEPGQVLQVARAFGYVRTTNYGELFDVRVEPQPINLAYTGRGIAPHTDNPYREPVPGIQLLHCLMSSASGGENVLIDGFSAAAILRDCDPGAFATLTSTPMTFRFDDRHTALCASAPVVETNAAGEIRAIRWNDRSIEPPQVAPERIPEVYRALRAFADVLCRADLHVRLTLAPGDCIVFDNTRILHARTAFTDGAGARHLQGCYADLDALASAVAVAGRRAGSAFDAMQRAFESAGAREYLGEAVTMVQHQLQAGALAAAAGAPDSLVVAALLHDIGHIVGAEFGAEEAAPAMAADVDHRHDSTGAAWLAQWFPAAVSEPVRLHVAAKRYLVAVEPTYAAALSPASVHTLRLQGGPMDSGEVAEFAGRAHAADAVMLRRFDEAAKDASRIVPGLEHYRTLIERCVR